MSDIFLAYGRPDQAVAKQIAAELSSRGWSVFYDALIQGGERWDQRLESELEAAKVVVVLWSASSRSRQFVLEEAQRALARNALVPVKIENVEPPYGFSRVQTVNLTGWTPGATHEGMSDLVMSLTVRISVPTGTPPPPIQVGVSIGAPPLPPSPPPNPPGPPSSPAPSPAPASSSKTTIAVAVIGAIATIVAAFIGLHKASDTSIPGQGPISSAPASAALPASTAIATPSAPTPVVELTPETSVGAQQPSGHCKEFSGEYTYCTPTKEAGWSIRYDLKPSIGLQGDRSCGAFSTCRITEQQPYRMCMGFTLQGHDDECGHSGNTGIHLSAPVISVIWSHPK